MAEALADTSSCDRASAFSQKKLSPWLNHELRSWRKREDSNLRYISAYTISSRAPSTTRPRFHIPFYHKNRSEGPQNTPQRIFSTAHTALHRRIFQFEDKIVQMGVFLVSCAVIDRVTAPKNAQMGDFDSNYGMPDTIRTYDLWLRKPTLYPTELRAHMWTKKQQTLHFIPPFKD